MVGQILSTVAKVGSSIYGAIKSSQANKRAERLLQNQRDENQRWYDQRMAEDYTQRTDVQNVLRKQRELLQEQYRRAQATNIVAGGTDESLALQKQAANEAMGETMANLAAQGADYKERVEEKYRATDAALNQQQIGIEQAKAKNIAEAAGQMGSAVGGLMSDLGKAKSTAMTPEGLQAFANAQMDIAKTQEEELAELDDIPKIIA